MIRRGVAAAAVVLVAQVIPAPGSYAETTQVTAGPPADYRRIEGLSEIRYRDIVQEELMLEMSDGIEIYAEVTRPAGRGRFPVIAEISPYHGTVYDRDGWRMLPDQGGLVDYFVPRGYAVVMVDLRGSGRSQGCFDLLGRDDQADIKAAVEWAASQSWSNGRVGVMGHSYPGATAVWAAAQQPKGLATIVVSAGPGSMYEHQFQAGVPYAFTWAGPYIGYPPLVVERHLPVGLPGVGSGRGGDNLGNDMEYFGCWAGSTPAVTGDDQLSGRYAVWHAERDVRKEAAAAPVPAFVVHGVNDQAARVESLDWFNRRNGRASGREVADKLWLGQWDHGVGCCPTRRGYQWTRALHAWLDRHLQGRDVDTGPPVEVFLADAEQNEAAEGARTEIFTAPIFPGEPRMAALYPDAGGDLSTLKPFDRGEVSFAGDALGFFAPQSTGGATFRTAPLTRSLLMVGVPRLRLAASVTAPRIHLIANLYDESPEGTRRRISQFAINPELREGIGTTSLIVPGERYVLRPPGRPMAHHLRKGHRLVLRVTTSDPDKVPLFAVDPNVTVFTGPNDTTLAVPVIDRGVLYPDRLNIRPPRD